MQPALARALVAELIGTFALVFAGAGAIMVDAKTHALVHVGVAISFGLVIMMMIYAVGHISGAHFNPSVSFAFALTRHFPWPRAFVYWAAQVAGASIAAAILRASLGNIAHVGATLPVGIARTVVPVGGRVDLLPDVRDHGRRNGHTRGRGGGGDRDRRHGRSGRDVRRPDLRRIDEPGTLARARDRLRRPARTLALRRGAAARRAALGALAYQFVRGEQAFAPEVREVATEEKAA
jgi:hypothetical protein